MTTAYDCVIIGAGHNGLICAADLADAGWRVLVLERREVVGGACVTEEPWPGLQSLDGQLCRQPAAARNRTRPRTRSTRLPRIASQPVVVHPDRGRPLVAARARWRIQPSRDRQVLRIRRRGVSPLRITARTDRRAPRTRVVPSGPQPAAPAQVMASTRSLLEDPGCRLGLVASPGPGRSGRGSARGDRVADRGRTTDSRPLVRIGRAQEHARNRCDHRHVPTDLGSGHRLRASAPRDGIGRWSPWSLGLRRGGHGWSLQCTGRRGDRAGCRNPYRVHGGAGSRPTAPR